VGTVLVNRKLFSNFSIFFIFKKFLIYFSYFYFFFVNHRFSDPKSHIRTISIKLGKCCEKVCFIAWQGVLALQLP